MDWKKTGMEVVHADAADESLRMQTLDGLNCGFSIHLWLQGGLAAPSQVQIGMLLLGWSRRIALNLGNYLHWDIRGGSYLLAVCGFWHHRPDLSVFCAEKHCSFATEGARIWH